MTEYNVGQIFIDSYPSEAATFCNQSGGKYFIKEIEPEDNHRRFQIVEDIKSLDEIKSEKIAELKSNRDRNEQDYFVYDGHRYDNDHNACLRIDGTVEAANVAGDDFEIDWTDYDNNEVTLDKAGLQGLVVARALHSQACHKQYREKKEAVNEALSAEEISAIVWEEITK